MAKSTYHKHQIASFDVDAQNTFTPICPDELPVKGGDEIAAQLNLQAQYARLRVASKDAHNLNAHWMATDKHPQYSPLKADNMDVYWNAHAIVGTQGFQLISGLPAVCDYDYFVWKGIELDMHPYGACYHDFAEKLSTGVIEYLKIEGIKLVIVGGLALDFCVKTTALQLKRAGFEVIINLAACRAITAETEQRAKTEMLATGIEFVDSAEQLNSITQEPK